MKNTKIKLIWLLLFLVLTGGSILTAFVTYLLT
jgi:hypothetical protein